jgi:hypothetical protein
MNTTVILNDFETGKRFINMIDNTDMAVIKKVWMLGDTILAEMQEHPAFAGKQRWCDLDPKHFTIMIISILNSAAKLSDHDRVDITHPVVSSLRFLYSALIMCLQSRCDSIIEMIRFNRLGENDVTYDFTATFNIFEGNYAFKNTPPVGSAKLGLKLVVDNDDDNE